MTFEVDNEHYGVVVFSVGAVGEVTSYREITPIQFHFYLLRICAHNCLIR